MMESSKSISEQIKEEGANCRLARKLVSDYILGATDERKKFDRAKIEEAFKHIYWCQARGWMCAELWRSLKFHNTEQSYKERARIRDIESELKERIDAEIVLLLTKWEKEPESFMRPVTPGNFWV